MFYPPITSFYIQLQLCKQFIHQYFILQLVQSRPFANILFHQNFPTYGILYIVQLAELPSILIVYFLAWSIPQVLLQGLRVGVVESHKVLCSSSFKNLTVQMASTEVFSCSDKMMPHQQFISLASDVMIDHLSHPTRVM